MDDPRLLPAPGQDTETPRAASRRRGRVWPWLLLLCALLGLAAWLVLRHPWSAAGRRAPPNPPVTVGVGTVGPADLRVVLQGLGTVTPLATVTVRAEIAGTLQTVGFREGQMVKRGDFLAQIDPRPTQALLEQARGALARDQALLKQAQTNYQRYAKLNRQDSISRQQVEDQAFLVSQYMGTVAADQGQVDAQKVNLDYCRIVSPVTGRVGLRQVDPGNYVQVSDTNGIVVVTELDPISVIFTLPEDEVPAILQRLGAGATLEVQAWDRGDTTELADGKLETIDNQVDTTTGTVKLRAIFPNPENRLFPNQFVNARLVLQVLHQVTAVPNAAIQTGSPGSYAWLMKPDGTVQAAPLKLGVADGDHTQVLSGLSPGDRVVIDGADRLKDGAHVVVAGTRHPGAGGGATGHRHGGH